MHIFEALIYKLNAMQTILGAGGSIGTDLAKELLPYTTDIRLVSRDPKKVNDSDELFTADLTDSDRVMDAVRGSEVVYLMVGLEYKASVWQDLWPKVMQNTMDACKEHRAKLVFFDNVYMYDPSKMGHMTEDTPVNPSSRKGAVRARIRQMLLDEVKAGNLEALIARSADFYGPGIGNSILQEGVVKPLSKGKKASWFCSVNKKHSFTFTPDAAKATALLGNTVSAYGEEWHLPTAGDPPTGKEWIEAFAKEFGVKPKYQVGTHFLIRVMGIFNPLMKEMVEMLYQYDRDYVFDSSKFEKAFDMKPTPYHEGIKKVAESYK